MKHFFTILLCISFWSITDAIIREHFVAVVQREWDYAPLGNILRKNDTDDSDLYIVNRFQGLTIGSKYIKAFYREYTDASFTVEKKTPESWGILGTFLKAEIGDTLVVHFRNMAQGHNFTMHPHGVFYKKNSEGAMYVDGTCCADKLDDAVKPGETHTYTWQIFPEYGPTNDDPNCITWLVHSHQFAEEEVMTGAIGLIATCKNGVLDSKGNRLDVKREYPLLFMIFDENFSVYREENIQRYLGPNSEQRIINNFPQFQQSNRKNSINGFIYGNLPGLEACYGDKVSFHVAVLGNDEDVHSVYLQGHTMTVYHHRVDTIGMYPGSSITANFVADNIGKWLLSSQNVFNIEAGMQAIFNVKNCYGKSKYIPSPRKVRHYYIAAEEVLWNYAPSNRNLIKPNTPLLSEDNETSDTFGRSTDSDCKLNGVYYKAVFRGYTDQNFNRRCPREAHWGFLGPPIKAEVGDIVYVHFFNNASRSYSLQAYRFFVPYNENGIRYDRGPADVAVPPGGRRTYTWYVPESVGPAEVDPYCVTGRYYSAVDAVRDNYAGLTGPVVVCKPGNIDSYGKNYYLDNEFYLSFSDVIESQSHYWERNLQRACPRISEEQRNDNDFLESNTMRSLNGRIYGNLRALSMCQAARVGWYMMSVGSGMSDIHSPHFHGNTIMVNNQTKDTFVLTADTFATAYMTPLNVGNWSLEDQVTLYIQGVTQMEFIYEVRGNCGRRYYKTPLSGVTRTYYIAAVEREWDYAPINRHIITGQRLDVNEVSRLYYVNSPEELLMGHKLKKALYREYTDASFRTEKVRDANDIHLGMLGPFIRAEVGDVIQVVFKNMAAHPFSIMPHGVFYNKSMEGYAYNDGYPPRYKRGAAVAPNQIFTYRWFVPEDAGPGYDDFNCVTWAYLSHVDYTSDLNAGLCGPLVICKPGTLGRNGRRRDVNREWALYFFIVNENDTPYVDDNIRTYLGVEPTDAIKSNETFFNSNAKLSINGYIFGNVPNVTMRQRDTTAINIISFGDTTSTHTIHFHGNTAVRRVSGLHRHDVFDVLPGDFEMVEMLGYNKGTWLVHCHVNNHSENGMDMVYNVV